MGACISNKQERQKKLKDIEREIDIKKDEKIILFVGPSQCGKSSIIKQIMYAANSQRINNQDEYIKSQYKFKSFIINEYTTPLIKEHASNSLNHLKFINRNLRSIKYPFYHRGVENHIKSLLSDDLEKKNKEYIPDEVLCKAYICRIEGGSKAPMDIIKLIQSFYAEHLIQCHKIIDINSHSPYKIYDLWELSMDDIGYWDELYRDIELVVFVCDISSYDQYDGDNINKQNKLVKYLNLFDEFINNPKMKHGVQAVMVFNKVDILLQKVLTQWRLVGKCPLFEHVATDIEECKSNQQVLDVVKDVLEGIVKDKSSNNSLQTIIDYTKTTDDHNMDVFLKNLRNYLVEIRNNYVLRHNEYAAEITRIYSDYATY